MWSGSRLRAKTRHRFAFHDRKAWWQQEQAILTYLILQGIAPDEEFLQNARESAAFYNAFFLDHYDGAVYFNVLASGVPFLMGTERFKGSHSMSGYHSFELCYLAQVYTNLLIAKHPLDLFFKPRPWAFPGNLLRVAPDILPPGRVALRKVWIDDEPYHHFDPRALTVSLPDKRRSGTGQGPSRTRGVVVLGRPQLAATLTSHLKGMSWPVSRSPRRKR